MNVFPSVLFFNQKFENEFLFWAVNSLNSPKRICTLYKASSYGVEKVDFTPYLKMHSADEFEKFKDYAQKNNIEYTLIDTYKVGISDPECIEFEEVIAPCYELIGNSFVLLPNSFITRKYPTQNMLDRAYSYYNQAKTKLITEYLNEILLDIDEKGCIRLDNLRFYPSYYLDPTKYFVKYLKYGNKSHAIIYKYSNFSLKSDIGTAIIGYEGNQTA